MHVFESCVQILGNNATIVPLEETHQFLQRTVDHIPFTWWARIDWDQIEISDDIDTPTSIPSYLEQYERNIDAPIWIFWSDGKLPALKTTIQPVIDVIDDVTMVSFDTWVCCPDEGYIIEFYHEGEIKIGYVGVW